MDSTIVNPAVPYSGRILNGLWPGRVIVICGFIPHSAQRFNIDLLSSDSTAIHINPRFDQGCIVRNHQTPSGGWGPEERYPHGLGGLFQGQDFEMMILTELTHFKISVCGRHFTEFAHRIPFQSVVTLSIAGDIHLKRIEYKVNYSAPAYPVQPGFPPAFCHSVPALIPSGASKHRPIYNPALPLKYRVLGGLESGYVISLSGRPTNVPHRFSVNLCCGGSPCSSEDLAFHFNVRFDQGCVVRNSLISGAWGSEERGGGLPFQAGVNFDFVIRVFPSCLEMTVNGQYFGTYTHRIMPLIRVDRLDVDGDVIVSSLRFL